MYNKAYRFEISSAQRSLNYFIVGKLFNSGFGTICGSISFVLSTLELIQAF